MKPEDVPAELVDRGYAAMLDAGYRVVEDIGDQVPEDQAVRRVLAAALPEYGARVLEEAVEYLAEVEAGLDETEGMTAAMGHLGRLADRKRSEVPGA